MIPFYALVFKRNKGPSARYKIRYCYTPHKQSKSRILNLAHLLYTLVRSIVRFKKFTCAPSGESSDGFCFYFPLQTDISI